MEMSAVQDVYKISIISNFRSDKRIINAMTDKRSCYLLFY